MKTKYITLKESGFDWYFTNPEIKVLDEDIIFIKPLKEDYSIKLWTKYISNNKKERHLMLLNNENWCTKHIKLLYSRNDDWNRKFYKNFSKILINEINYNNNDNIFLFWMVNHID